MLEESGIGQFRESLGGRSSIVSTDGEAGHRRQRVAQLVPIDDKGWMRYELDELEVCSVSALDCAIIRPTSGIPGDADWEQGVAKCVTRRATPGQAECHSNGIHED